MSAAALHPVPSPEPNSPKQTAWRTRLHLSERIENFCFWSTMVGLALATLYLAYLTLSHAALPDPSELSWGASTPEWLVDCFPLSIAGVCLGEAGHSFWRGMRSWKRLLVGAGFLLVRGIPQWFPSLSLLTHR